MCVFHCLRFEKQYDGEGSGAVSSWEVSDAVNSSIDLLPNLEICEHDMHSPDPLQ